MLERPVLHSVSLERSDKTKDTVRIYYKCHAEGVEIQGVDEGLSWVPGKGINAFKSPKVAEDGTPLFEAMLSIENRCEFRGRSWSKDKELWEDGENHVLERKKPGIIFLDGKPITTPDGEKKTPKEQPDLLSKQIRKAPPELNVPEPEAPADLFTWVISVAHFLEKASTFDNPRMDLLPQATRVFREIYPLTPSKQSFEFFMGFSSVLQVAIMKMREYKIRKQSGENIEEKLLWEEIFHALNEWKKEWKTATVEDMFPETDQEYSKAKIELDQYLLTFL